VQLIDVSSGPDVKCAHVRERCDHFTQRRVTRHLAEHLVQTAEFVQVLAFDIDQHQLAMAKHNAQVYGVAEQIDFVLGDAFELAPAYVVDAVFLSPPWGGPQDHGGKALFQPTMRIPQLGKCARSPHSETNALGAVSKR
jgi:23S rRNA G2445 N2-methylase RlmL